MNLHSFVELYNFFSTDFVKALKRNLLKGYLGCSKNRKQKKLQGALLKDILAIPKGSPLGIDRSNSLESRKPVYAISLKSSETQCETFRRQFKIPSKVQCKPASRQADRLSTMTKIRHHKRAP